MYMYMCSLYYYSDADVHELSIQRVMYSHVQEFSILLEIQSCT